MMFLRADTVIYLFQWSLAGNSLHSCPKATSQVDDYYVLPGVSTSSAKEVVIDIAYTLRCCSHVLKIGLYALHTLTLIHIPPRPMDHSYLHVADLVNTSIILQSRSGTFNTRSYVAVEGYPYLYIAFRTQGFCGSVDAISMHYFKCEAVSKNLVTYPETAAPRHKAKTVQVSGNCKQQSFPVTAAASNNMICYSNGTSTITGGCQCMAGYQNISDSSCSGMSNTIVFITLWFPFDVRAGGCLPLCYIGEFWRRLRPSSSEHMLVG